IPFNSDSGFFSDLLTLDSLHAPQTTKEYEDYVARLDDIPRYFAEHIANARTGMREGFTLPAAVLDGVSKIVAAAQYRPPEATPFWLPFAKFPERVPEPDRTRLAQAGRQALAAAVIPAYAAFQRFFEDEYRPAARRTIGASALPDGSAYYADLVRY